MMDHGANENKEDEGDKIGEEHTGCVQNMGFVLARRTDGIGLDLLFENDRRVNTFTGRMGGICEQRSTEKLPHLSLRCGSW